MLYFENKFFTTYYFLPTILFLSTIYLLLATFAYSQSGWGPDVRLTYRQGYSYDPWAVCCGDTIHLVWWEGYVVSGNIHEEVFYKRSTDAGATWGEDVMLTPEDAISAVLPSIAVWSNNVHVAWEEEYAYYYAICYRKSTDGGNTWGIIDTLHKTNMSGMRGNPRLCVFKDTVCLVMTRDDGNVLFMKSVDNGANWDSTIVIGDGAAHPCFKRSKLNNLYLVVSVDASEIGEIIFYKSTNCGVSWSDSEFVSEVDNAGSQHPAMDTDDSTGIHITWFDYKYSPYSWTGDIFYRASRDSGNTWEEIDSLTVMHRAIASDILAEGNNLHLVWEDDRNGFDNNFEIYYRMSTDLGRTWLSEERLTNAINHSKRPSLACDGRYLHLFWYDLRDDPNNIVGEIYYKRKDLETGIREVKKAFSNSADLSLDCSTILTSNLLIRYHLGNNKYGVISLIDVTGRVIKNFPVHQVSGELVIPFNKEVQDGLYFIMLKSGSDYITKKVLVVR